MRLPSTSQLFLSLLILALTGCGNQAESSLRLALHNWPGYEALSLAKTRGLYKNVDITTYRTSNSSETILAFENDIVDVASVTLVESIEIQSRNDEAIMIFAVLDTSHGGDVIIAKKEIKSISDLKGKRVGMVPTALGAYFLSRAIESAADFSLNQINVIPVTVDHHLEMFLADKVDAVVTYEPAKSQILEQRGHIVFDSTFIPNEIIDVLVTKISFAEKNPRALTELLNGYFKALDTLKIDHESAVKEMAVFEKIEPGQFEKSLSGIRIPDRNENMSLMGGANPKLTFFAKKTHAFLKKNNIIKKGNDRLPLINGMFLSSQRNNQI